MNYREKSDQILDRWEVGSISTTQAAGELWEVNRFSVRTAWWRRRDEGVDGLFYQAILESIPKFHRGYRTAFLTFSLQRLKDILTTLDGSARRGRDTQEAVETDPFQTYHPGATQDFILRLEERRDALKKKPLKGADLKRRRVLDLILEDRTIKQTAKATRQGAEEVREILLEEWTEWNNL